jgi:hypothetical protein
MKLGIFSHCTIDEIAIGGDLYERPGGPACYCSLAARSLGFDVDLVTNLDQILHSLTSYKKTRSNFKTLPVQSQQHASLWK